MPIELEIAVVDEERQRCLYCGRQTPKGRKGEHILPAAIGGALTLNAVKRNRVCQPCNNTALSRIDEELCARSFLSAIASRVLDKPLWQAWDVDEPGRHQLVEANAIWRPDGSLSALKTYPQVTFELDGPEVRGDAPDFREFGLEHSSKSLIQAVRNCYARHRNGKKAIHFQRVRSDIVPETCRLSPRVFTRNTIRDVARNVRDESFILRYATQRDKLFALQSLHDLSRLQLRSWSNLPGSREPPIAFFFDAGDTMRALMKIGLNLLAAFCDDTPVTFDSFRDAIRVIRDEHGPVHPRVLRANGFIAANDIHNATGNESEHSFQIYHQGGVWFVHASFFGGLCGSLVRVPGPNREKWQCLNIIAPIHSTEWIVEKSPIFPAVKLPIVRWADGGNVVPSLQLENKGSQLIIEYSIRRKQA